MCVCDRNEREWVQCDGNGKIPMIAKGPKMMPRKRRILRIIFILSFISLDTYVKISAEKCDPDF